MTQKQIIFEVICWILTAVAFIGSQLIIHRPTRFHHGAGLIIWFITDIGSILFYGYHKMWALTLLSVIYTIQTVVATNRFIRPKVAIKQKRKKRKQNKTSKRSHKNWL